MRNEKIKALESDYGFTVFAVGDKEITVTLLDDGTMDTVFGIDAGEESFEKEYRYSNEAIDRDELGNIIDWDDVASMVLNDYLEGEAQN